MVQMMEYLVNLVQDGILMVHEHLSDLLLQLLDRVL